jgi:hypothetical protein
MLREIFGLKRGEVIQDVEENFIMWSFITCTLRQV